MKAFYQIINGQAQVGQGDIIPDSFIEYTIGQEPQELLEALEAERVATEAQAVKAEALAYLANTDWYYARKSETGEEVPAEVVAKRIAMRGVINGSN